MTITKIKQTKDLTALINYMKNEKDSDEKNGRVAYFSSWNCTFSNAENEMMDYIRLLGKENNVQGIHIIQSFRDDELDPNDEDSIRKANEMGFRLAGELYSDHQFLVVTQIDGDGGYIHNHIAVNQSSLIDGKSLTDKQKHHYHIAQTSDRVLKEYNVTNVLDGKIAYYRDDKSVNEDYIRENDKYVYKDDLRDRLDEILESEPESFDEFKNWCEQYGITIESHKAKNRAEDYQYHFMDRTGKKRHVVGKRLDSKSKKYTKESVSKFIEDNQKEVEPQIPVMSEREKEQFKNMLDGLNMWESYANSQLRKYPHYADFYEEYKNQRYEAMRQAELERERANIEQMEDVSSEGSDEPLDVVSVQDEVQVESVPKVAEKPSSGLSDDELMAKLGLAEINAGLNDKVVSNDRGLEK